MEHIKFYKVNDDFGFLSNFAPYQIFIDGLIWPSSEHYFQAAKFFNEEIRAKIRQLNSAMDAATEGRKRSNNIREDWDEIKIDVMRRAIKAKFFQHHDIMQKLLATGEAKLIEHTINDNFWGDGGNGTGKNMLGVLLMELRQNLENICPSSNWILPPWIAFPTISQFDMFWRMGLGESYMYNWAKWYNNEETSIQAKYKIEFPINQDWEGFYD